MIAEQNSDPTTPSLERPNEVNTHTTDSPIISAAEANPVADSPETTESGAIETELTTSESTEPETIESEAPETATLSDKPPSRENSPTETALPDHDAAVRTETSATPTAEGASEEAPTAVEGIEILPDAPFEEEEDEEDEQEQTVERYAGSISLVGVPIGNDADITIRALGRLAYADVVICEEYKVAARLLRAHNISKKLIEMNEHNEEEVSDEVIEMVKAGKNVAVISDAGLPLLADPGSILLTKARALGIEPKIVPGVSSVMTALMASGFPLDEFDFVGFLPRKTAERAAGARALARRHRTVALLETPYRLRSLLSMLADAMPDRPAALAVNLTMPVERVFRGTLASLWERFANRKFKGEFVVVLGPIDEPATAGMQDDVGTVQSDEADADERPSAFRTEGTTGGLSPVTRKRRPEEAPPRREFSRSGGRFDDREHRGGGGRSGTDRRQRDDRGGPRAKEGRRDEWKPRSEGRFGGERENRSEGGGFSGRKFGEGRGDRPGNRFGGGRENRSEGAGFGGGRKFEGRGDRPGNRFGGGRENRSEGAGFGGGRKFGEGRENRPGPGGGRENRSEGGGSGGGRFSEGRSDRPSGRFGGNRDNRSGSGRPGGGRPGGAGRFGGGKFKGGKRKP